MHLSFNNYFYQFVKNINKAHFPKKYRFLVCLNCDDAEMVGLPIQCSPDGMSMENMTIKRNSKAKAFQDLLPPTTIGEKKVFISTTIFFSCLTVLSNFPDDVEQNFSFKLPTKPATLFKQEMMRKPTRANLQNHFIENEIPVNLDVRDDHRK